MCEYLCRVPGYHVPGLYGHGHDRTRSYYDIITYCRTFQNRTSGTNAHSVPNRDLTLIGLFIHRYAAIFRN